mgnify:CR=1 FL=1
MKDKYLRETRMVDFSNPAIQKLIQNMKWKEMGEFERIKAIYNYVRDDILFGYNIDDGISASKVLADGYGQCNTKGTLFMHFYVPVIFHAEYMVLRLIKKVLKKLWNLKEREAEESIAIKNLNSIILKIVKLNRRVSAIFSSDFISFDKAFMRSIILTAFNSSLSDF